MLTARELILQELEDPQGISDKNRKFFADLGVAEKDMQDVFRIVKNLLELRKNKRYTLQGKFVINAPELAGLSGISTQRLRGVINRYGAAVGKRVLKKALVWERGFFMPSGAGAFGKGVMPNRVGTGGPVEAVVRTE